MAAIERDSVVTTLKRCAIRLAMWNAASPMPITGARASERAASRPLSSKQAMMWASAPFCSPLAISISNPGSEIASS